MRPAASVPVRLGRLLSGLVAVVGVLALVTACGSDSGGDGTAPAPPASSGSAATGGSAPAGGGSTVVIDNFMFMPATVTVAAGTTVTWKFNDSTQHTVTADDNSFNSSPMANGQTFTHTFSAAGTVTYHCSIHPFMKGTIVVT